MHVHAHTHTHMCTGHHLHLPLRSRREFAPMLRSDPPRRGRSGDTKTRGAAHSSRGRTRLALLPRKGRRAKTAERLPRSDARIHVTMTQMRQVQVLPSRCPVWVNSASVTLRPPGVWLVQSGGRAGPPGAHDSGWCFQFPGL